VFLQPLPFRKTQETLSWQTKRPYNLAVSPQTLLVEAAGCLNNFGNLTS